jgi:hypothetical protein
MSGYSTHWTCLFPQCGPGAKHTRPILLRPWQEKLALVDHPEQFVRGLIHSDGWRGNNPVRGASGKRYVYTRYQFSNRSPDIRDLFVPVQVSSLDRSIDPVRARSGIRTRMSFRTMVFETIA